MAVPVYEDRGAFSAFGGSSTNDVDYPTTVILDDILIILILAFGNRTATTPTNWNALADTQDTRSVITLWKRATGSESGTETVTLSSSVNSTSIMMRFSGCITTGTPYESLVNGGHVDSNTQDTGELTTTGIDRLAAAIHVITTEYTPTTPTGYTTEFNEIQASFDTSMTLFTQEQLTAGTVSAEAATTVAGSDRFMQTFALIPVGTSEDTLTSTDIEAQNPVVQTATITQDQDLTSTDVESQNPLVQAATLAQEHSLISVIIEAQSPVIGTPTLSESNTLISTNIETENPIVEDATIGQLHALLSSIIETESPIIQDVTIGQIHELNANIIEAQNPVISEPDLSEATLLISTDIQANNPVIGNPTLSQEHSLSSANILASAPLIQVALLTQIHGLLSNDIISGNPIVGNPNFPELEPYKPFIKREILNIVESTLDPFIKRETILTNDPTFKPFIKR